MVSEMTFQPNRESKHFRQVCRDLTNELNEIEEIAHNVSMPEAYSVPSDVADGNVSNEEIMDTSYESDFLTTLEKEIQQVCGRLACIIDNIGPVFPRSKDHAIQSYFMRLLKEIKSMKLINEKNAQQEKGFREKIILLQLQRNSLERAVSGLQMRLKAEKEEIERANVLLQRVHKEFTETRKDLHYVISELFPDDGEKMRSLLADLTATHFSDNPQNWTDVSPYLNSHVELLLRDCIIELNPASSKLARFTI